MNTLFEITFEGVVWKSSYHNNHLALEIRNEANHETTFHVLQLSDLNITASFHGSFDKWMSGLDLIYEDKVYIHGYDNAQNIHKQGVSIYNLAGALEREYSDLQFIASSQDGPIFINSEEQAIILNNENVEVYNQPLSPFEDTTISNPIHYSTSEPHFETVKSFIMNELEDEAVGAIEYLEVSSKICISYYLYRDNKMTNHLAVFSLEGSLLFKEELDKDLTGVGYGTFFVIDSTLYYIKNKNTLIGLAI